MEGDDNFDDEGFDDDDQFDNADTKPAQNTNEETPPDRITNQQAKLEGDNEPEKGETSKSESRSNERLHLCLTHYSRT